MALWQQERITLSIDDDVVRLMGVHKNKVTRWGSAPLPRGTIQDGEVNNPTTLAEALEKLWHSQQRDGKPAPRDQVLLAIPGHRIPTRMVPLPDEQKRSNKEQLARQAKETLPDQDAYHAWQIVGPRHKPSLFVMAAPKALVDGYVEPLRGIGLGIVAVDIKPLALIRGVGQRHTVIVDGERAMGSIIIVDEALPRRARFPQLHARLLAPPEEKIMRLAESLYETIQAYNNGPMGQALHPAIPVYLTGSLAHHGLLQDVVKEVFGHPVGRLTTSLELPPQMPLSQFVVNVGLAQKRV